MGLLSHKLASLWEAFPALKRRLLAHRMLILFSLLGLIILGFIFLPLLKMMFSSSPGTLWDALQEGGVRSAIWLSLYAALLATVVGLLLGVPLAYLLARCDFPGKRVVEGLIDVPIVVPHAVVGIALLFVFGQKFLAGSFFHSLGIDFVGATPGIIIAMLFVSVPFLIDSAKEGFQAVDVRLERVARTLGASPWQTFFRVSLPLAWRSILSGSIMMWARGISEFGAILILAYHPKVASIEIWERFENYGLDSAIPVAALLLSVCLVLFIVLRTVAYRGKKA